MSKFTEAEIIQQFRQEMLNKGIGTDAEIIPDGVIHRFRVDGDARSSKNGFYLLHIDGVPNGIFGCCKRYGNDTKFKWVMSRGASDMTDAERQELRASSEKKRKIREQQRLERLQRAAEIAQHAWDCAVDADDSHPYLMRKKVKSHGLKVGTWDKINPDTGEATTISDNALLIPIKASRTAIRSLQAIFPDNKNPLKRNKDFLTDGEKSGNFFVIGSAPIDNIFIVTEGYATAATIHECVGHMVIVAFDAGNLLSVGRRIKSFFPSADIVFAADNDQWTTEPIVNPGVARALAAAQALNARSIVPTFKDTKTKPTDFNDLMLLEGREEVIEQFDRFFTPPIDVEQIEQDEIAVTTDNPLPPEMAMDSTLTAQEIEGRFKILGYDHGDYYIFHYGKKQILRYTKADFGVSGLIELSDINFWEQNFPAKDGGISKNAAFNFFVGVSHQRGIYDIDRIRGRGVWIDEGRVIFHHGDRLTVDGNKIPVTALKSRYVYELSRSLPAPAEKMLTNEEGERIYHIACKFGWTKPASAALIVGWIMLAPICGALKWRPHIWLTGGAGCGKSTILTKFVHGLIGGSGIIGQGASTEAGIRQELKADALPVMLDEAESNDERDKQRVQSVITMIRQSSSESHARTFKGTPGGDALRFHIRSMFCLASIQVGIRNQADIERLTVLLLRGKTDINDDDKRAKAWASIEEDLYGIERDPTLPSRLLRRAIDLLPVIQENIKVFVSAAAKKFGNQRDGDQYGTLLAGACALMRNVVATEEQATRFINSFEWEEHRDRAEVDDSTLALYALTEAHVRVHGGAEVTVFELIASAAGAGKGNGITKDSADATLARYGMRVERNGYSYWLLVSNNSNTLRMLLQGTPYDVDYRGMLLRVPGADRNGNQNARFNGVSSKCIRIPLNDMLKASFADSWREDQE